MSMRDESRPSAKKVTAQLRDELCGAIALAESTVFGLREKVVLSEKFGGALNVLRAGESAWRDTGMSDAQTAELRALPDRIKACEHRIEALARRGIIAISCIDPIYPERLKQIPDYPLVLYARGEATHLKRQRYLAVVGSRRMTDYGFKAVQALVPELVTAGFVIVSGMAFGVDAAAHEACLGANGVTVAVQALGVTEPYPKSHLRLFEKIISRGIVVSEFADTPVYSGPELFPRRNRLISGLSDGVLVIEAGKPSGTLVTAALATDQNRQVFAVPGSIFSPLSAGCIGLIRQGAKPVTVADDIIEDLSASELTVPTCVATAPTFASEMERRLYELCATEPRDIDELIEKSGGTTAAVAAILARLELSGHLRATLARKFHIA